MVEYYLASQKRFTSDIQAHYIYSPCELTRWVRGIYQSIKPLVSEEAKRWTDEQIDAMAVEHFPSLNQSEALARPILFSNWTSKHYISVDRDELRDYFKARLRVFYEEGLQITCILRGRTGRSIGFVQRCLRSPALNRCQWKWQNYSALICGLDEWIECIPNQGSQ
ncbi:dynein heavy chain 1, cytosolic [Puccinia sorghi]|uniref:Dynein heavy chain 1, cytosolic n=1 Tax=Puccinia sorghi TaxID=27349 RepID=A0A0L6UDF8_9BASI|nr:dynein heavy chain 1, cytosolic [Puccinia sorghi]